MTLNHSMRTIHASSAALLAALWAAPALAAPGEGPTSPNAYAGEQARPIKALSAQETAGLLAGQGAGFAKAAELNGYPGPAHTLELKQQLALTERQVQASEALMAGHRSRAKALGAALIEAERALDAVFSGGQADGAAVEDATREVGLRQARLRAEHLNTHLAQTALLDAEQVRRYSVLRGYTGARASPLEEQHPGHGRIDFNQEHR